MTSIVAMNRILPKHNKLNKICSEKSTIEVSNKSMSILKESCNSSFGNTCKERIEADVNVKKEHTPLAKNSPVQSLQENETDMPINKNTSLDISETGRTDSTDSITQMKTSVLDVPKIQSRTSTEVTPKKLQLKDESSTNNLIKEEDKNLSNKENRASNISEDSQKKDATVSNILPHSSQPLFVSDVSTEKSVKLNEEDADSSDNMQTLIVTDTDSSSGTPCNDSIGRNISGIEVKKTQKSTQQEEINEAGNIINDEGVKSEDENERVENQREKIQNTENASTRIPITNNVSKQSPLANYIFIEKLVDKNVTNEIDQNLNVLSTESFLNNRESKSELFDNVSKKRKSIHKSVEKSDDEVEEPKEVNIAEKEDSLNKSPASSPSNVSDLSKTDESIDSDIEREYNLHGGEISKFSDDDVPSDECKASDVSDLSKTDESIDSDIEREYNLHGAEVSKFSDDDVPGDECRASETELSDPDDNGSDLADFVVTDNDEITEEEIDSNESSEESYNGRSDRHRESDNDTIDEQCRKIQIQEESDEKTVKEGKQKRMDTNTFKKEKSKFKKSVKLNLNKSIDSDKKITKPETRIIDKKRKRIRIDDSDDDISGGNVEGSGNEEKLDNRKIVERQKIGEEEGDKQYRKVQIHKELVRKVTKKGQRKKGTKENVQAIQNKWIDIPRKEKSQLGMKTKLDLVEKLESGKNVKRKSEIEINNKIKKMKEEDNDNKMLKENAIPSWIKYENPVTKSNKIEVSRKRPRNLLEEVIYVFSDIPMNKSKKRKLLHPEELQMPSNSDNFPSSYGSTTNFYVSNIQKLKKRKNAREIHLFRQRMLNRRGRFILCNVFGRAKSFMYTQV